MRDHLAGRLPGAIGADRLWSFSYVDDVADAHVAAAAHANPGAEYTVGGVNAPQRAIYEHLREARGRPLPRRIPYGIATLGALGQEIYSAISGRAPLLTRGDVEIFRHDWSLDSSAAQAELGLRVTPLSDGLSRTLAAL